MPIKVTCQCGQRFTAKDELQGRRVKCPKCSQPLTIPAPEPAAPELPRAESLGPPPVLPDETFAVSDAGAGPPPMPESGTTCPSCGASVTPETAMCVKCGYNFELGGQLPMPTGGVAARARGGTASSARSGQSGDADFRAWIHVITGLNISFVSLFVHVIGFGIISLVVLIGVNDPTVLAGLGLTGTTLLGFMLFWCMLGVLASYVSLLTAWVVCCVVPERSGARPAALGAAGCVGAIVGLLLLMQLILMAASPPSSPSGAQTLGTVMKGIMWLVTLAWLGSYAAFGFFLGGLGDYFGHARLRQLAVYFCAYQGAVALWMTLLMFVLDARSEMMVKLTIFVSFALPLAGFGWLLYLNQEARKLLRRNV